MSDIHDGIDAPPARRRGRPPKQKPEIVQEPAQAAPERVMRDGNINVDRRTGRLSITGRDGTVLARRRADQGSKDTFHIPEHLIPRGWDYQWNTYTVAGEPAADARLNMADNGWRPVPAERHAGVFMPPDYKGAIIRGGLILEERPLALTEEARREDLDRARSQVRDQSRELGLKNHLGRGFSESRQYRGAGADIRQNVDPAMDAPRPQHEVEAP